LAGENKVIILENDFTRTTPTPTPPTNPPESTPSPTPTVTPTPSPTPTPIESDEFIIEDTDPAFGPETGEGDALFIAIGVLVLLAGVLFAIRKRFIVNQ
jgi:LPXTG-motif cell wall-anchored protein